MRDSSVADCMFCPRFDRINNIIEEVDKLKGTKAAKLDPNIWTAEDLEFLDDNQGDNRETPE